jgi:phosphoribosylformimino-5-aminoimidazole carboxamide ribotide isomerase
VELFPAVDLRGGRAVRLVQGDFGRERAYGDPLELARRFAKAGARWLHVVDLDGARAGEPVQLDLVRALAALGVPLQVGGGVRSEAALEKVLAAGAARVVLGTAWVDDPGFVVRAAKAHPGGVAVALDHRPAPGGGREVAVEGWARGSGLGLLEVLGRLEGVPIAAVLLTAVERDGTFSGPDLSGLAAALGATAVPVLASGGVGSLVDLRALAALEHGGRRLAGVVVGRALVDGRLGIDEALAVLERGGG